MTSESRHRPTGGSADLLVVGLGNPGRGYVGTRHNAGRRAVDELARRNGLRWHRARREHASIAEMFVADQKAVLVVPDTYMNESGRAVGPIVRRYSIRDLARLVVIHDELDLPVGRLRFKAGGGLAGHRGLKSIEAHLHSRSFTRVRIGIGRPGRGAGARGPVIDHVLGQPGKAEKDELLRAVNRAADAVECLAKDGLESAMSRFNTSAHLEPGSQDLSA